jgi:hypothetical protein
VSRVNPFELTNEAAISLAAQHPDSYWSVALELDDIFRHLPDSHLWRYDERESLVGFSHGVTVAAVEELLDAFRADAETTTLGMAWRVREAAASAVSDLNAGRIVTFVSSARLALESTIVALSREITFSNRIRAMEVAKNDEAFDVALEEFDVDNNQFLYGRKMNDVETFSWAATSVPTHLKRVLKNLDDKPPIQKMVSRTYEQLCEITHPNAEGVQVYWDLSNAEPILEGAPSYRWLRFDQGLRVPDTHLGLLAGLWALGWSADQATACYHRLRAMKFIVERRSGRYGFSIDRSSSLND